MGPSIANVLWRGARRHPDKAAILFGERTWSYALLAERAARVAHAIRGGLKRAPGETVAILSPNTGEYAEVMLGAAAAQTPCVTINHRLSASEVARILADSAARVVFVHPRCQSTTEGVVASGYDGALVRLDDSPGGYEALLSRASANWTALGEASDEHPALLSYTSGTTGVPRGAMISHRGLQAYALAHLCDGSVSADDIHLVLTPLCSAAGTRLFATLQAGATTLIHSEFSPERVLHTILAEGVTTTMVVPTMLRQLVALIADGSQLVAPRFRMLLYGAAPMPQDLLESALAKLATSFYQGYGTTETLTLTTLKPADHTGSTQELRQRLTSVGREFFGTAIRIVDDSGQQVPPGEVGEVVARGATIMDGYWRAPEATAEVLRSGWLHTGDLGTMDAAGYVRLVDRKKDLIISGGFNIIPAELERVLLQHPLVAEAAVAGKPDPKWGEVPVAFVKLAGPADQAVVAAALDAHCRQYLAGYKVPKEYRLTDALPRNALGKLLRKTLREKLRGLA